MALSKLHITKISIIFVVAALPLVACNPEANDEAVDGKNAEAIIVEAESELNTCPGQVLPLYRYWNPSIGDHFYTTNWAELGGGRSGYTFEGVAGALVDANHIPCGAVPLFRYWNAGGGDHFYTTNWSELEGGRSGYAYEGIQGYCFPTPRDGTVPLFRYWNAGATDHFYTTNWGELAGGMSGWAFEGIQCYVRPS